MAETASAIRCCHGYASASLTAQVGGVAVWHIGADEPTALDYDTDFTTDDRYAPTAFRASDHDPVLVGLTWPRIR